jgi:N-ethylmaleimide reductase
LAKELGKLGLAYLHCIEGQTRGQNAATEFDFKALHASFGGKYIANNGYNRRLAIDSVASGYADMIAFGHYYIGNPDLVERLRRNAPLTEADKATYYGGGAKGYTDYKTLSETVSV